MKAIVVTDQAAGTAGMTLVACPVVARLHLPRRDQKDPLAVSRRQVAVESEVVFQGANTIGQLRYVHQHAERAAYPAPHGGSHA
jgi:hypothetical protein